MEEIIKRRLTSDEELTAMLAQYYNEPAIFYAKSGYDVDSEVNYPQLIFFVEKFSDPAHDIIGTLNVEIICSANTISPEPIEKVLRKSLENVLFKSGEIFILTWQKTEAFQERASETTPLIVGLSIIFEIHELPNGVTAAPDAVQALQEWSAHVLPEVVIVGWSNFGEVFEPSREKPALWISQSELKMERQVNCTVFVEASMNFHMFAPNVSARREWLSALYQELIFAKAVKLFDGTPLRLQDCELNFSASQLSGQIKALFEYGILKRDTIAHPLNRVVTAHSGEIKSYENYLRR